MIALLLHCLLAAPPQTAKEALAPFNEFVGAWRAVGTPEGNSAARNREQWKEAWSWSWRFKGGDTVVVLEITNGKHYRGSEIRYLPKGDQFEVKLLPKADGAEPLVFKGRMSADGRKLVAERTDEENNTLRLTLALVGEIRGRYALERRPAGRTAFVKVLTVEAQREGESLAGQPANTKPECVVSGGLGTITVSHKGVTYYVCCSGCRDAFNEDPEKYIKEYEEKKRKGKN